MTMPMARRLSAPAPVAVASGTAPTPSARDGREALVLAEAAARSLATGAAVPVPLSAHPVPEEMR